MRSNMRSIFALLSLLFSLTLTLAQTTTSGAPAPGSTVSLLFLNTTSAPLTAYIQKWDPSGQTTYLVNCAASDVDTCGIHDATLSIVQGETYDFHTAVNNGGALTIHCTFEANGRTPASCTRTVAGGPDGYEISTTVPTASQWAYLPVRITAKAQNNGGYEVSGSAAIMSATNSAESAMSTTASTGVATTSAASTENATTTTMSGNGVGRTAGVGGMVLLALTSLPLLLLLA